MDEPRLLARHSASATPTPTRALPGEPEAISEEEQARQTLAARRAQERQQREAWAQARARIVDGVSIVRTTKPAMPRQVVSTVRVIERAVARVDAELRGLG